MAAPVAASVTVLAMGPAVSWLWLMGTMPRRDTRAMVGFRPTTPLTLAGPVMEPEVSVPTVAAAKLAAAVPGAAVEAQPTVAVSGLWQTQFAGAAATVSLTQSGPNVIGTYVNTPPLMPGAICTMSWPFAKSRITSWPPAPTK